jgi:predicted dienelactone hydrolase
VRTLTFLTLLTLLAACARAPGGAIDDVDRGREIKFAIWLPEVKEPAPLVVLSHGSGGHYNNFAWLTKVLNSNGYVVAAVNHPFNTVNDNTPEGVARAWDRPPDLSLLLDELLKNPTWAAAIDSKRIGAAGFSSGGYTVLALGGAIYDIQRMHSYCASSERGAECELSVALPLEDPLASESTKDSRIRAIFSMAPGWGAAATEESLRSIDIPVKIVATVDDEWLKPQHHAEYFAGNIPDSQLVLLPKGGHFLFLSCDGATRVADWFIDQFNLCGTGIDVDRKSEQKEIANMAVDFFDANLVPNAKAL